MWTSYFSDGFWDILFGMIFLGGGLRTLTDNVAFSLFPLFGVLTFILGRKFITFPRLGRVEFGKGRKRRSRIMMISILLMVIITFILWAVTAITSFKPGIGPGMLLIILVPASFFFISWLLQFWRLAVYGILFTVEMSLYEFAGMREGGIFALFLGIVVLIIGSTYLVRFMRKYPRED